MARQVTSITSVQNARVKQLVRLREQRHRRKTGLFIADELRQIERAVDAGFVLAELYYLPDESDAVRIASRVRDGDSDVALYEINQAVYDKISYGNNKDGAVAVFEQREWAWEQLLQSTDESPGLWLILVGIEKPGNVGAMLRTADAAGCTGVILADAVVDAYNPNALRASTGAVFTMPMISDTSQAVRERLADATFILTTPAAEQAWCDAAMSGPTAIVIGPEDTGLDDGWLSMAGDRAKPVSIPMLGQTADSLNASVTASILLFEAVRQRRN